mgnify:CR=1 FL=1
MLTRNFWLGNTSGVNHSAMESTMYRNPIVSGNLERLRSLGYRTVGPGSGFLASTGVDRKIVEKSGTWFSYGGERIGQGRENVKQYPAENPAMAKEIEGKVLAHYGLTARPGN